MFPMIRYRRNRQYSWIRDLVSETELLPKHLIYPVFVMDGRNLRKEIKTMPSVYILSIDNLLLAAKEAEDLGIKAIALFPYVESALKDLEATEALNPQNLICRAVRALKDSGLSIGIICDVALDPYTSHGHDGIVIDNDVSNDATVDILCKQAALLSAAGADIVAPSDMMDGRIGVIRKYLDLHGFQNICILSYAAKYASSFYGPFRDAIGSNTSLNKASKATYQMDMRNSKEAIREVSLDIDEGADMVMIKPGMPYLDIVRDIANHSKLPVFVYQVSGEYAMLKYASDSECFDFNRAMMESLIGFRRAGATAIFTYAALDIARYLKSH